MRYVHRYISTTERYQVGRIAGLQHDVAPPLAQVFGAGWNERGRAGHLCPVSSPLIVASVRRVWEKKSVAADHL
ncbi:MAG: hypothetical protein QM724_04620 [Flavobacteriales bacterium]